MDYLSLFRMPTSLKITGRSSSITNAFVNAIIPVIKPSAAEVKEALELLEMTTPGTFPCSYCGDPASEWDHLNPLVANKKPTGYITEINNLVPSCGKCNQSKGNKPWRVWIESAAKLSPKTRGVKDLSKRVERLTAYEKLKIPRKFNFEAIAGPTMWIEHTANLAEVLKAMRKSQDLAAKINVKVSEAYVSPKSRANR